MQSFPLITHRAVPVPPTPSGLDHGMGSAGEGYVTNDPQLADFPEVLHPMVVLQQMNIIDRNLEVVGFNQDLYFEWFAALKGES